MRFAVFAALVFAAAPARAAEFRVGAADAALAAGGMSAWVASELGKPMIAPKACRFCETEVNALDAGARGALLWRDTPAAARLSDAGLVLVPVSASLLTLGSGKPSVPLLLVAQSIVLTANVNQATKLAVGRSRPYARFKNDVGVDPAKGDDHLSFFSGHAASTFSAAAATYAWMREARPQAAPYAGGALLAGALFTGYARIAADRHYLSDVLVGAAVGSAIGWTTVESHRVPASPSGRPAATVTLAF